MTDDTTATSGAAPADMTLDDLKKIIDALTQTIYYATDPLMEKGMCLICDETIAAPKFFICNPDDLETLRNALKGSAVLVHIRDEPRDQMMERTIRNMKKLAKQIVSNERGKLKTLGRWMNRNE